MGDSFLENQQGLTTLKIYQADAHQHQVMNEQSERFRKITMKVLSMQLNSIIVTWILLPTAEPLWGLSWRHGNST